MYHLTTRFILLLTATIALTSISIRAHELGIFHAELELIQPDSIVFSVRAGSAGPLAFNLPEVEPECPGTIIVRNSHHRGWIRFVVTGCDLYRIRSLILYWPAQGLMLRVRSPYSPEYTFFQPSKGGLIEIELTGLMREVPLTRGQSGRFLSLGIGHILLGYDHLLFVFSLLLLVQAPWMLVKTITAFTIAHSLTLALASLGLLSVSNELVDVLVALSIVFAAAEAVPGRGRSSALALRRPWLLAFVFGLLHGLGFANALSGLGLPREEIPLALLTFNAGVEIGQLAFVAAFLTVLWSARVLDIRSPSWSRPVPAYLTGTMASVWFVQRLISLFDY